MNAVVQETTAAPTESTDLVVRSNLAKVESALTEFEKIEAGLSELRSKYGGVVFDVKTTAGMEEAVVARREVRDPRYNVEKARKAGKSQLAEIGRGVEARAVYITDELLKIENPIHAQIKAEEDRKEAEKQARIEAEQNRIRAIQGFIDDIKRYAIEASGQSAANIATAMDALEKEQIDERFGEFKDTGMDAKVHTMNKLREMHSAAADKEAAEKAEEERRAAEDARLKAEREELERQKAAQAERERVAHVEAIERARKEKSLVDEGIRRRLKEDKAARDKIEADQAAAKARIEAQEREAREARAKVDAEALALRIAEEQRLRSIREQEEKHIVAEREKLERERFAKEKRDKEAADKIEAKARAKREKEEAAERARLLKEQERMDARQMLEAFVTRFGHLEEFAGVVKAIDALMEQQRKAA